MLFLATAMQCAVKNRFSYGKKLRSSQSFDFTMRLPVKNGMPDYEYMENFITTVQKLVIRDVVRYGEQKIKAAKCAITQTHIQ